MMHWYLLVIALVQLVRSCTPPLPAGAAVAAAAATADDYTILSINLATNATDAATGAIHEVKATFVLRYSVVVAGGWRQAVTEDFRSTPFAGDIPQVHAYIENELARHGFHPDVVQHGTPLLEAEGLLRVEGLYTHGAVHQLVQTAAAAALPALVREQAGHHDNDDNDNNRRRRRGRGRVLFTARREVGAAANPLDDARDVTAEMQGAHDAAPWNRPSVLPHFLRYPDPPAPYRPPRILIYQVEPITSLPSSPLQLATLTHILLCANTPTDAARPAGCTRAARSPWSSWASASSRWATEPPSATRTTCTGNRLATTRGSLLLHYPCSAPSEQPLFFQILSLYLCQ
jgi:hypothetical protein